MGNIGLKFFSKSEKCIGQIVFLTKKTFEKVKAENL